MEAASPATVRASRTRVIVICGRALREWLWIVWLQGLSWVVILEPAVVIRSTCGVTSPVTHCVTDGPAKDTKGGHRQPRRVVSGGSSRT